MLDGSDNGVLHLGLLSFLTPIHYTVSRKEHNILGMGYVHIFRWKCVEVKIDVLLLFHFIIGIVPFRPLFYVDMKIHVMLTYICVCHCTVSTIQ